MWACLIANHEALALAQRFGVDVDLLREALLKTGAENGVLRNWGTSTMAWADDDLEIIQSMAQRRRHRAAAGGLEPRVVSGAEAEEVSSWTSTVCEPAVVTGPTRRKD